MTETNYLLKTTNELMALNTEGLTEEQIHTQKRKIVTDNYKLLMDEMGTPVEVTEDNLLDMVKGIFNARKEGG